MNPNLLTVITVATTRIPLMMDGVAVPRKEGPFLITSSKSLLWVEDAFGDGFLRLAVRQVPLVDLFRALVESIAEVGAKRAWGNVLPATKEGVLEGLSHLHYYDLRDVSLLYGADFDIGVAADLPRVPADWLPPSWAVLVPDRDFVGTAFTFNEGRVGAVVHNPSRGVVVLRCKGGLLADVVG